METKEELITLQDLRRIVDSIPEVVYSATLTDTVKMNFISRSVEKLTGYSADQIISGEKPWMDIVYKIDRQDVQDAFERCRKNAESIKQEYRIKSKNGEVWDILDCASPLFDDAGQVIGIDGLIMNISLTKRAERELQRTQMLQNIGRLAAGIVHEINTPVQFIGDNMHFLSDSFKQLMTLIQEFKNFRDIAEKGPVSPEDIEKIEAAQQAADLEFLSDEVPKAVEQTIDGVQRVTTIVAAMRDFSHIDERRMAPADINKALQSTLIVTHNKLKYVANIETDLEKSLPQVMCCIDDLNQVFVNLLVNGAHSIAEKLGKDSGQVGTIKVVTRKEGKNVVIAISDTGTGITDAVKKKMFEPFFTTKGHDKGTGQGLLFVKTIVQDKHKGTIDCDTEVGKGTTFTIKIPIEVQEKKQAKDERKEENPVR